MIYQFWPASLPDNPADSEDLEVKTVQAMTRMGLEFKAGMPDGRAAAAEAIGRAASDPRTVVRCSVCDAPAALVTGGLTAGQRLICGECISGIGIDDLVEPPPTVEEDYASAVAAEVPYELGLDGEIERARDYTATGRAWRPQPGWATRRHVSADHAEVADGGMHVDDMTMAEVHEIMAWYAAGQISAEEAVTVAWPAYRYAVEARKQRGENSYYTDPDAASDPDAWIGVALARHTGVITPEQHEAIDDEITRRC